MKELGIMDIDKDMTPEKVDVLFSKVVNQKVSPDSLVGSVRPHTSDSVKHQRKTTMDLDQFIGVNLEIAVNSVKGLAPASKLEQ